MERIVQRGSSTLAILATVSACLIMIAISLDVATRKFTGGSLPGMVDVTETLMVIIVFFGIARTEMDGQHIRMTLVTDRLPKRLAQVLRSLSYLCYGAITAWITYATARRALVSFERREYRAGLLQWPLWPARIAIVIGLAVLLLAVVVQCATVIRNGSRTDER